MAVNQTQYTQAMDTDTVSGYPMPRVKAQLSDPAGNSSVVTATADAQANANALVVAGRLQGFNGATWDRLVTMGTNMDGMSTGMTGIMQVHSSLMAFNGVTYDRFRNNMEQTLLPSASRTATTSTANLKNYNHKGLTLFLNVTAASGTGGLTIQLMSVDPVSGMMTAIHAMPTAITANGLYVYNFSPEIATGSPVAGVNNYNTMLPRTWMVQVMHGDATAYTYSLGSSLNL